jgi:hypothetical protein
VKSKKAIGGSDIFHIHQAIPGIAIAANITTRWLLNRDRRRLTDSPVVTAAVKKKNAYSRIDLPTPPRGTAYKGA